MLKIVWSQMLANDARGYGKVAQELGWALERAGAVMLDRQDFGWDYKIVVSTPRAWYHTDGKTVQEDFIYHTMYDADLLPEPWVKCYNLAGYIWVPSKWCKDVFVRSGVRRPVIVSGYGVDDERYFYSPPPPFKNGPDELFEMAEAKLNEPILMPDWMRQQMGEEAWQAMAARMEAMKQPVKKDSPFVFLSIATSLFDRKGPLNAIRAFRELDAPNAKLLLKFNSGMSVTVEGEPNIDCIVGDFSKQEFIELIRRSHCVIYPSSGEGFGLIPLEAMALGRPVIVTDYSGMREYIDERYCYPLEIEGIQRAEPYTTMYDAEGSWAMISDDTLCDLMQRVYDNYEEAMEKGRLASEHVLQEWTWKQAGERAYRLLEQLKYEGVNNGSYSTNTRTDLSGSG